MKKDKIKERGIKAWLLVARAPFLLLTVLLVSLGTAVAWYDGFLNVFYFILALVGMLLVHIACNMLNEYFDYKSGLDFKTPKTPFSGGSGALPAGLVRAEDVYRISLLCLVIASTIGVYFILVQGLMLLPLIIVAVISTYFYTTHFSRIMLGEFIAGLNFGPLAVLGAYFAQTGFYGLGALTASLVPGILTANLLLINQFPDADEDARVGRKHLVIAFGRKKSSRLYAFLMVLAYLPIISGAVLGIMPPATLLALLTFPLAFRTIKGVLREYDNINGLIPFMGMNVKTMLSTQFLMIVGYLISLI